MGRARKKPEEQPETPEGVEPEAAESAPEAAESEPEAAEGPSSEASDT